MTSHRLTTDLKKLGWKNSSYGLTLGEDEETRLVIQDDRENGGVLIALLFVDPLHRGKGLGQKAMSQIISIADANGILLRLKAAPVGPDGLSETGLHDFYGQCGFVGSGDMVRPPIGRENGLDL